MDVLGSQSFMYWLLMPFSLSLEAKGFVAKDEDLLEEFMRSNQLAVNFQCSGIDSFCLFLQEKHWEFYVFHLPASISKVQKEKFLSSEGSEYLFSEEVMDSLVSDFQGNTSLTTQLALQKAVRAAQSPLVPPFMMGKRNVILNSLSCSKQVIGSK